MDMTRRTVIGTGMIALAATTLPSLGNAAVPTGFTLPPLPYAKDALEPVIDTETMTLHHDKHHQAYVDALNKAIAANPAFAGESLEQLLAHAGTLPAAIRNNAGGHWNHSFFWQSMAPVGKTGAASADFAAAVAKQYGSLDGLKTAFDESGAKHFASGWTWLLVRPDGQLAITSTPGHDNPLMDVAEVKGTPILVNDVWEHAYYLKHQNRRPEYLSNWWNVVDWTQVSSRYGSAARR